MGGDYVGATHIAVGTRRGQLPARHLRSQHGTRSRVPVSLRTMTHGSDSPLGEMIRQQRELAELSLRQVAAMVGISGPYLSQIERGLRLPSQRVLDAIAESLHTSADTLSAQARAQSRATNDQADVPAAIRRDPKLTAPQRQALLEIYAALIRAK